MKIEETNDFHIARKGGGGSNSMVLCCAPEILAQRVHVAVWYILRAQKLQKLAGPSMYYVATWTC